MSAPRLLDQVRQTARLRHLSLRTERAYTGWVYRFVGFNDKRHPSSMGAVEVRRFLSHLATAGRVSASTQNQALCALLFLYGTCWKLNLAGSMKWYAPAAHVAFRSYSAVKRLDPCWRISPERTR